MSQLMPGEFLPVCQSDCKRAAGCPHTSWLATMKNCLSLTGKATL